MDDEYAQKAIDALNDKEFDGRNLKVNQAHSK
jgi:RNA recognition motif-containing protein